jgi:hypothetical protein
MAEEPSPRGEWITRNRVAIFALVNIAVLLAAIVGSSLHDIPIGRALYADLLFALCTLPLVWLSSLNGRYFLLSVFMALYFLFFGALDLQALFMGEEIHPIHDGLLDSAEIAILLGGGLALCGYLVGVRTGYRGEHDTTQIKEWPRNAILVLGVVLWCAGTFAMLYFSLFAAPEKTARSAQQGFSKLGPLLTFMVMLAHMLGPLGVLILGYGYARFRKLLWLVLTLTVLFGNVIVGFVTDVKSEAFVGAAIVILTKALVDNRLPRIWMAGGVVFVMLTFPMFQAYRAEIAGERGLNRLQAFQELPKVLAIAFESRDKVTSGREGERSETFIERTDSKRNVEILMEHAGKDVPLLRGLSLIALPMAFVPRLLVPDKEDIPVGLLFSRDILKGDRDTYISISQLGELYWNFGWAGILLGMPLIGMLLGYVGGRCSLEHHQSLTRLLILMATVQTLCIGFGGSIPVSYIVWMRSVAAIGLLHLVLAKPAAAPERRSAGGGAQDARPAPLLPVHPSPRFSNIMR